MDILSHLPAGSADQRTFVSLNSIQERTQTWRKFPIWAENIFCSHTVVSGTLEK